jgi:hypothetical protein
MSAATAAEISLCASDREAREERIAANLTFRAKDLEALPPLPGRVVPSELKAHGPVTLSHPVSRGWYRYAGADGATYLIEIPDRGQPQIYRPCIRGAS